MSLLVRDNRVIVPSLRTGAPTAGAISDMDITDSGVRFTEVIDVGWATELILFAQVTALTAGTLDAIIQFSPDGKTFTDMTGDNITQLTAVGIGFKKVTANFGKYIRIKITLGAGSNMTANMWLVCKG
jgi:hypothetical protein